MYTIRDYNDLKGAYLVLKFIEETIKEIGDKRNHDSIDRYVIEVKKAIRTYRDKSINHDGSFNRMVKDYGIDGYAEIIGCPFTVESMEDAHEYFMNIFYIEPLESIFDCTGAAFTLWYKIFKRHETWHIWHEVRFNV